MTPTQADDLIFILSRIAIALEGSAAKTAPDLVMDISRYPNFDWSSIAAELVESDQHGAVVVSHNGKLYTRRTHTKFGVDIWYSRATGKSEDDKNIYEKLISFKEIATHAEPLPEKTVKLLETLEALKPVALKLDAAPDYKDRLNAVRKLTKHTGTQVNAIASTVLKRDLKEQPPDSDEVALIRNALLVDYGSKFVSDPDQALTEGTDAEVCDRFMAAIEKHREPVAQ